MTVVLDSSAILALLKGESGAAEVAAVLDGARLSTVNLAEVVTKLIERGLFREEAEESVDRLPVVVVDLDRDLAIQSGLLRATTRHKGLSLGDRACLALAIRDGLPVMTTDQAWSDLDLPIEVVLIR